jgi:hypothetical protein
VGISIQPDEKMNSIFLISIGLAAKCKDESPRWGLL